MKKKSDLWDIFKQKKEECTQTKSILEWALFKDKYWKGYSEALFDFGVITKSDMIEIQQWK